MILKLEKTLSTAQQIKDQTQNPYTKYGGDNKQRINNKMTTVLEWTSAEATECGVLKLF